MRALNFKLENKCYNNIIDPIFHNTKQYHLIDKLSIKLSAVLGRQLNDEIKTKLMFCSRKETNK